MFNQNNQQQCRKFWQLARTITPSDLIALWCNQEPSEFNAFLANTGYLPSCADAKKALLLEALENKELDYIDDGLPYNGSLWIGGNITELLAKNRIRLEKDKAKTWIISLHNKGDLGSLPNFLLDDHNATTANDGNQQQIADLQAENARLQARITQLESQLNQANTTPANLKGLEKVNYDKAKAKLFAQIVAKSIWDMDTTEQIKSGDMVQYVKSLLLQFDDDSRPQTDEVISDWLRDIKPSYAKQSGRPSKNTPNEIPLTFKK